MSSINDAQQTSDPQDGLVEWIYESECDEYNEDLYPYAIAQQNGELGTELFPALAAHLALCPKCRALYRELQFMLESEARAGLAVDAEQSQLVAPQLQPSALTEAMGHTIHQGITWVFEQTHHMLRVWVSGAELLANPPPWTEGWTAQAAAVRGPATESKHEWRLRTREIKADPITASDAEIRVVVVTDPADDQRVIWQIEVIQPDRWPDFAGISVTLYPATGEPQHRTTGRDGMIQFTDLARQDLATMQIAIELPLE